LGLCVVGLAIVAISPSAHAQRRTYSNYLIGDEAPGLAGAYVALASDASAVFHNPAGMAWVPRGALSSSLWAAAYVSESRPDGYETSLGTSDLDFWDILARPQFLALVTKLGGAGPDGISDHSLGFAILNPYRREYGYLANQEMGNQVARLEVVEDTWVSWYGASYAYRAARDAALGASLFLAYTSENYLETETRGAEGALGDTSPGAVRTNSTTLHSASFHLLLRFGGKLELPEGWSVGAMLQPPGPPLFVTGYLSVLRTEAAPDGTLSFDSLDRDIDETDWMAWEMRAGVARTRGSHTLSFDASMLGPQPGHAGSDQALQHLMAASTRLPATYRASLGVRIFEDSVVPLRGGVLYEFTPGTAGDETSSDALAEHTYGGSFSAGWRRDRFNLSLGATLAQTRGGEFVPTYTNDNSEYGYASTPMRTTTVYVFLSGGAEAALALTDGR